MQQIATITSKRQLTIPVNIYKKLGFKAGQKVIISKIKNGAKIEPAISLLDRIAGSVKTPKRLKGMSVDQMVKIAREERFSNK